MLNWNLESGLIKFCFYSQCLTNQGPKHIEIEKTTSETRKRFFSGDWSNAGKTRFSTTRDSELHSTPVAPSWLVQAYCRLTGASCCWCSGASSIAGTLHWLPSCCPTDPPICTSSPSNVSQRIANTFCCKALWPWVNLRKRELTNSCQAVCVSTRSFLSLLDWS